MEDPTTIAINLTFLGTLGVAFVMFVGLFAVFVATLVTAGLGRLVALIVTAIAVRLSPGSGAAARALQPQLPTPVGTAGKEAPQLSADWAAAVARADERAAFRSQGSNQRPASAPQQRKAG